MDKETMEAMRKMEDVLKQGERLKKAMLASVKNGAEPSTSIRFLMGIIYGFAEQCELSEEELNDILESAHLAEMCAKKGIPHFEF